MSTRAVLTALVALVLVTSTLAEDGSHWIVLPSKITPGVPLPLTFTFYNTTEDVVVKCDLLKDDHHLLKTSTFTFTQGNSEIVMLQVPNDLDYHNGDSKYLLLVHGLSGLFFVDHALLEYDAAIREDSFAIHIQMDKAIYKPGQTVRFRAFGLTSDMMVYTGEMNISIYDSKNNHMKQLTNVSESEYGVVEDSFIMDTEPVLGTWRVEVSIHDKNKAHAKSFSVDEYVLPKFDVKVELPPYVLTSDKEVHGTVKATYTYGKPVIGKVLLRGDLDYFYSPWKYHGDEVMVELHLDINGEAKFTLPLDRISNEVNPNTFVPLVQLLKGSHVIAMASVTESLNNITRNATAKTLFYDQPYKIAFDSESSPTYFKPGLPYTAHATILQANGVPVISTANDIRLVTFVKFYDKDLYQDRAHSLPDRMFSPPPTGVLELSIDPPDFAKSLHLEVHYKGLTTTLNVQLPSWLRNGTISVLRNTTVGNVGHYASFTVLTVEPVDEMFYMVVGETEIVELSEKVNGSLINFMVTKEMKPYSQLIVYYFKRDGYTWNADSLYFEVTDGDDAFKNKLALDFDKKTGEPHENVTLQITTDPLSMVSILAVDQSVMLLKTGNDITKNDVFASFKPRSPPYTIYSSHIHDPQQIMKTKGMQVLTDVPHFSFLHPHYKRQIDCSQFMNGGSGAMTGMTGTGTGSGGSGSQLATVSRTRDFFPETWLWTSKMAGADGTASIATNIPDTITSWLATGLSFNKMSGLGITDSAAKVTTFRPFFVSLNLPYSVVRGEEIALQANVFNYMGQDLDVVLTLSKSFDILAVVNDASGNIDYQMIDIVKTVHIKAGKAESVFIPIVAAMVGVAEINVKAQSILAADGVKRQLKVVAEGTPMHFNIPLILKAGQPMEHVQIDLPKTFVADSQKVQITAIGDVMGPTLNNLKQLVRMPTGCGEQTMINLAPDVYIYNYLKATNQLTPELATKTTNYIQKGYQRELTFQRNDGSFSIWGQSDYQGSLWLTAFVLKAFSQAKDNIYVSDNVLSRAKTWIVRKQNSDGSFQNSGAVHSTILRGGSNSKDSMAAFVLIALMETEVSDPNDPKNNYNYLAVRTRAYLERQVYTMTNMYDLAIVSYALAKSGSRSSASIAYAKLATMSIPTTDGSTYWSSASQTKPSPDSWEYMYYRSPPLDVEIASYALLYLIESKQAMNGLPILKWLVSQRNEMGGFRSTQDTVLALQAMSEFGEMLSGNGMDLNIDVGTFNFSQKMHIGSKDKMVLHIADVSYQHLPPTSNGSKTIVPTIDLEATGTGAALVHVGVTFNVETKVIDPAFNLTTTILSESVRSLIVETCAQYLPKKFSVPGMAVIEFDIPTGFSAEIDSDETKMPLVKKTETKDQTLSLYYDQIMPSLPTCATIEMIRTELVAATKPAAIRVFDYYEPNNRGLDFYQSTLLKDSSVCNICPECGCVKTMG